MGADRSLAPEGTNETGPTCTGSSATAEWYFMGAENGRTVARYARTLWQVDNHLQSLPALAQGKRLGQVVCQIAERTGCGEQCGLGNPFH